MEYTMKFSYAKDKKNEGSYNVRAIGINATGFAGKTVTVTTAGGAEKIETLGKCFWDGLGDDGVPVALYAKAGGNATAQPSNGGNAALEKRVAALEAQVRSLLAIMQTNAPSNPLQEDLPF